MYHFAVPPCVILLKVYQCPPPRVEYVAFPLLRAVLHLLPHFRAANVSQGPLCVKVQEGAVDDLYGVVSIGSTISSTLRDVTTKQRLFS